ncbi:MAG: hypothetical protein AB203_02320 [Parcubacteria bacterium C7867-008]|nr:MAG: hypothetical protein AB203_02320 [Parcubacteria bacterium C7867-008]
MGLLKAIKSRGLLWVSVHGLLFAFDKYVEYILYPKALDSYGMVKGLGVMIVFSLVVCWALLLFYDWVSTIDMSQVKHPLLQKLVYALSDALGFEGLKEIGTHFHSRFFALVRIHPLLGRVINGLGRVLFFLYLSFNHDGMTCIILMRPAHSHRMTISYWMLFLASVVLSCVGWAIIVGTGMYLLQTYVPGIWNIYERVITFLT